MGAHYGASIVLLYTLLLSVENTEDGTDAI